MPDFNPALPKAPKVYEAREKPERGTPLGLIRRPLAEPRMVNVQVKVCRHCGAEAPLHSGPIPHFKGCSRLPRPE